MEDLVRYLDEVVEPTIREFEDNHTSVRHAFIACVVTFHSVDYWAFPKKSAALRGELRKKSADFKIIDDVAHAFKHVTAGNRSDPRLTADQVIRRPGSTFGEFVFNHSVFGDRGGVSIKNKPTVDVLSTLKRTVGFLRAQISD